MPDYDFDQLQSADTAQAGHNTTAAAQTVGCVQTNNAGNNLGGCWGGYTTTYGPYYPTYIDRTQRAFAIAKWLIDKKLVKVPDVPAFITLIDGLANLV